MNRTMLISKTYHPAAGFTIVELMIASAVFAVVLLVALTGFLQIGRLFYKGVSITQTQDTTRQVVNDISSNIKATPTASSIIVNSNPSGSPYSYFCAGPYRYTYAKYMGGPDDGRPVEYSSSNSANYDPADWQHVNMGLVKDWVGAGFCPEPCVNSIPSVSCTDPAHPNRQPLAGNSPDELLGNNMRIGGLQLSPVSSGLYNLDLVIAYGDTDVLDFSGTYPACVGNSTDQRFCAVDQLSTSVFEGELTL
jgi:prepilin-type N-terminal cleavage/methylation domain-containing protein